MIALRFYPHDYVGDDWDDFLVVTEVDPSIGIAVPSIGDTVIYKSKSNRNVVAKVVERVIPMSVFIGSNIIELKVEIIRFGDKV